MTEEQWRPVSGFPGYDVSSAGRVRNRHGLVLRQHQLNSGYLKVDLRAEGRYYTRTVHRLVALAFVPNTECKPETNHRDTNKHNNEASNLEWATRRENLDHVLTQVNRELATWATSTTGVRGVTPHLEGGFIARATISGRREYLGYFPTIEAATAAVKDRKGFE